jgi:hypothetical protein
MKVPTILHGLRDADQTALGCDLSFHHFHGSGSAHEIIIEPFTLTTLEHQPIPVRMRLDCCFNYSEARFDRWDDTQDSDFSFRVQHRWILL